MLNQRSHELETRHMHESQNNTLDLPISNRTLNFRRVDLAFSAPGLEDIFAHKNNKALAETLAHHRYQSLCPMIMDTYPTSLELPLGSFLIGLKRAGDLTYMHKRRHDEQ